MVSVTVDKEIREILRSVLHSLAWSGQAAALQDALTHEARVYIHVVLSRRFPFLLLCDGGTWKINELIKQMYHGFKGSQIKRSKATVKTETTDGSGLLSGAPTGSKKRERQGSLLSIDDAANPAKSARLSAPPTHSTGPVTPDALQSLQPSVPPLPTLEMISSVPLLPTPSMPYPGSEPSVSTNVSQGADPTLAVPLSQATPSQAIPASDPPITIATSAPHPDNGSDTNTTQMWAGGSESGAYIFSPVNVSS